MKKSNKNIQVATIREDLKKTDYLFISDGVEVDKNAYYRYKPTKDEDSGDIMLLINGKWVEFMGIDFDYLVVKEDDI